ncbi:MAG: c-type cytochrome [Proteobacteria bacterium]|nr:c-type cytochrome [Pseudomonadota bacterium]MCH8176545.1 c-type cytochrome [Pseudomonadota bacterium]
MKKSPKPKLSLIRSVTWLFSITAVMCVASVQAQQINPLESDPRAARAGGVLYRSQCATCHGGDARGITGIDAPDLTLIWAAGTTDERVFQTIRNGVPGSIMPPHGFTDPETWMLVSYLRSVAATAATEFSGDAVRGSGLFLSNCARCHRVRGEGGSLGPDLSQITSRRSAAALINSVREPSAVIARRYQPVTVVFESVATGASRSPQRVQGTLKSEDAFSIQMMDTNQQLRAFMKADLLEFLRESDSLMPAFSRNELSSAELEDILTFLQSQL